jgi:CheY-like chemotaxis protein
MSLTDLVRATKAALSSDPPQALAKFEAHHDLVGPCEVMVKVGSGHKFTVDEPEVMAVIVGSLGYEVLTAGDAAGALELIRNHCGIDLLVSDIVMSGGGNGFELARRARALRPDLPILMMSGYPAGSVEKCNFSILHKPYRREQLATHIRAALGDPVIVNV